MIQSAKVNGVDIVYIAVEPGEAFVNHMQGATVKEIGKAAGADAAIDFNFADTGEGKPIGRVIVNGKTVVSDGPKTKARDELYMLPDGTWHIGKAPANAVHAVQGSPRILKAGKSFTAASVVRDQLADSSWKGKNYRAAGGVTAEGRLVAVRTLDKVDMDTLEDIMLALGCVDALNGDGGGSAYLWPHDNGWGRKMGTALCFKKGVKPMELTIKKDFIPIGRGNRPGHTLKPEFITIHLTGNKKKTADAANHAEYLAVNPASAAAPVSWHFTVDDGPIAYQHLPTTENGWHAGDGSNGPGNRKSIGIEVCENEGINQEQAWLNAAKLTAKLLFDHNLSITAVVQHNKWSGKNCPQDLRANNGAGWAKFLVNVEKERKALDPLPEEQKPVVVVDGFNDIHGHWAIGSMRKAIKAGVINGISAGVFAPDAPVTRAQWCVLMDRLGLLDKEVK